MTCLETVRADFGLPMSDVMRRIDRDCSRRYGHYPLWYTLLVVFRCCDLFKSIHFASSNVFTGSCGWHGKLRRIGDGC